MIIQQINNSTVNAPVVTEPITPIVPQKPEVSSDKAVKELSVNSKVQASSPQVVDGAELKNAVDQINKTIQAMAKNLQFSTERIQGQQVVKVVDNETHKVIRQIPSEEIVDIVKRLDELQGLLISNKA